LSLRHIADPGDTHARVGYAIGRHAGNAVQRNRIRRRLRAAVERAEREGRLAPGAYLVGAGPEALTMSFTELERAVGELVDGARGGGR